MTFLYNERKFIPIPNSLNVLYNYFDDLTKLFSDISAYSTFLDISAKFFCVRPVFIVHSYIEDSLNFSFKIL